MGKRRHGVDHALAPSRPCSGADDHHPSLLIISEVRLFSEGLAEALGRSPLLSAVQHCAGWSEAMAKIPTMRPDMFLVDASIHGGTALVRALRGLAPQGLVVVVALNETPDSVIAWAEAGVAGYIPKTAGLGDVLPTLLGIRRGEQACSASVAAGLIRRLRDQPNAGPAPGAAAQPVLTGRELQIIELISAGLSNKEIARRLNIGVATTKSHVHNLLGKLKIPRRSNAAIWMRENCPLANPPAHPGQTAGAIRPQAQPGGNETAIRQGAHPVLHPKVDTSGGLVRVE
jgi:DNA-binding NarL/FixJ family response regulator